MLTQLQIQRYKSLFEVKIDLSPLTVFVGPGGVGKSNICESVVVLGHILQQVTEHNEDSFNLFRQPRILHIQQAIATFMNNPQAENKFWRDDTALMGFTFSLTTNSKNKPLEYHIRISDQSVGFPIPKKFIQAFNRVDIYDFNPLALSQSVMGNAPLGFDGQGMANTLADILLHDRNRFIALENKFKTLAPTVSRIILSRQGDQIELGVVDKYANYTIPAAEMSYSALRVLAFLSALYQLDPPNIFCFEELENGLHPWVLRQIVEILQTISTQGLFGKPTQVLLTTHSPLLLTYLQPHHLRAVELDEAGKTQVHPFPTKAEDLQQVIDGFQGPLGESWFSNLKR